MSVIQKENENVINYKYSAFAILFETKHDHHAHEYSLSGSVTLYCICAHFLFCMPMKRFSTSSMAQ
jgi:hypothetical protein